VRFVRRVMAVAVNLEQVFLYGRVACQGWKDEVPSRFRYPTTEKQRRSVRKRMAQGTASRATILFPVPERSELFPTSLVT
jgi:hypothetical protein